jgi:hypothetical protein
MESQPIDNDDILDNILDELNEYHSLYDYVTDGKKVTDTALKFDGDAEKARKYQEGSQYLDLYDSDVSVDINGDSAHGNQMSNIQSSIDKSAEVETDEESKNTFETDAYSNNVQNSSSMISSNSSNSNGSSRSRINKPFLPILYSQPKSQPTTFQRPGEPRSKYLLRASQLWQCFLNSGNFDKLHILFNDVLAEKCLVYNLIGGVIVGRTKLLEFYMSIFRHVPDYCAFFSNVVRTKKRLIVSKGNSFGSFPYAGAHDSKTAAWNIFEHPIETLDENQLMQKQKYDSLKSQNKLIKFERSATWYLTLSRDLRCVEKIMATNIQAEVFSAN